MPACLPACPLRGEYRFHPCRENLSQYMDHAWAAQQLRDFPADIDTLVRIEVVRPESRG